MVKRQRAGDCVLLVEERFGCVLRSERLIAYDRPNAILHHIIVNPDTEEDRKADHRMQGRFFDERTIEEDDKRLIGDLRVGLSAIPQADPQNVARTAADALTSHADS
jgi:hypothetical protein